MRSITASRVSLPTSHSSIASTARQRRLRALRRRDLRNRPDLDRALRDPQRLEHAVRRVLEDVGEHAVAVEHAQHAVDLGRDLLAERRGRAATSCSSTIAGDSRPLESRTPSRNRSASANSSSCDSGICWRRTTSSWWKSKRASVHSSSWWSAAWPWIRPTCAEVTSPWKNRTSPRRRPRIRVSTALRPSADERAHQREHAGGLGEAADEVVALAGAACRGAAAPIVTTSRRYAGWSDDLVGAGGLGIGRGARRGRRTRSATSSCRLVAASRGLRTQLERAAVGAADDDQRRSSSPAARAWPTSTGIAGDATGDALALEAELDLPAGPRIGIEHDDFRESRHASAKECAV